MDNSEYRAKLVTATVCYAAMFVVVFFFLVNIITQEPSSGWPYSPNTSEQMKQLMEFFFKLSALAIVITSPNSLYVKSRRLFVENGFNLDGILWPLKFDMKLIGKGHKSMIRRNRDYYWLSFVIVISCAFFLGALSFIPPWVSFILLATFCNLAAQTI